MAKFNVLDMQWIPVLRRDGTEEWIAPHQITEGYETNPVVDFRSHMPEYESAYYQFLIGLIQTTYEPESGEQWEDFIYEPPDPEELKAAFGAYKEAFWLDGEGPRFFQVPLDGTTKRQSFPITGMVHDSVAKSYYSHVKPLHDKGSLHVREVIPLLISAQNEGSGESGGFYPSIRDGGPLTVILKGETLWQSIMLNVLTRSDMDDINGGVGIKGKIFPWLEPGFLDGSTRANQEVRAEQADPRMVFWAVSKNIILNFEGERVSSYIRFRSKRFYPKGGVGWTHPLTPYREYSGDEAVRKGTKQPVKALDITDLRDFLPIRYETSQMKKPGHLSKNMTAFHTHFADQIDFPVSVLVMGPRYESNQAKFYGYVDQEFPVLSQRRDQHDIMKARSFAVTTAYENMVKITADAVQRVQEENQKPWAAVADFAIWEMVEPEVLALLQQSVGELSSDPEAREATRELLIQCVEELMARIVNYFVEGFDRYIGYDADSPLTASAYRGEYSPHLLRGALRAALSKEAKKVKGVFK